MTDYQLTSSEFVVPRKSADVRWEGQMEALGRKLGDNFSISGGPFVNMLLAGFVSLVELNTLISILLIGEETVFHIRKATYLLTCFGKICLFK